MSTSHSVTCECSDPMCPECQGNCNHKATEILYRVDMEDRSGTAFCDQCSADAWDSGLFTGESEEDAPENDDSFDVEAESESKIN